MKSIEGEAQIVMARGKKRFIYDFNVVLDVEITTEEMRGDREGEEGKGSCPSIDVFPLCDLLLFCSEVVHFMPQSYSVSILFVLTS